MELPLLKSLKEAIDFTDEQVRNYAFQGIKVGQITYTNKSDKNLPVMSSNILKGCRELAKSQKKIKKFNTMEALLFTISRDPKTREDAKAQGGKARTYSGLGGEEKSDPKSIRTTSPLKRS